MLIEEIVGKLSEAQPAYKDDEDPRSSIPAGKTIKSNNYSYKWDKRFEAWWDEKLGRWVTPFSELDIDLVNIATDAIKLPGKTFNPLKLLRRGVSSIAQKAGASDIASATRRDPKAGVGQKTGAWIGGAIGRGIDKTFGLGQYQKQRDLPGVSEPAKYKPAFIKGDAVTYVLKSGNTVKNYEIEKTTIDPNTQEFDYVVRNNSGQYFVIDPERIISVQSAGDNTVKIVNQDLYNQVLKSKSAKPKAQKTQTKKPATRKIKSRATRRSPANRELPFGKRSSDSKLILPGDPDFKS